MHLKFWLRSTQDGHAQAAEKADEISREDVIWTYRIMLDREPESDAAIQGALTSGSRRAFVEQVLRSEEFQARRHIASQGLVNCPGLDVEWRTDPATLNTLTEHVAATWHVLGQERPHWSVLSTERFLPENIQASEETFYASGAGDADSLAVTIRRVGRSPDEFSSVFEYGCGLGRVTLHLAERFEQILACDISAPHLAMTLAKAQSQGIANIDFCEARPPDYGMFRTFDLWFSRIVLQHNTPPIASMILQRAMHMLNPGGLAVFQIPTYKPDYRFRVAEYLAGLQRSRDFEMHLVPQRTIFTIAAREGCQPLEVLEDNFAGWPWTSNSFVFVKAAVA
jgi:SAM-dependent methyltransferase